MHLRWRVLKIDIEKAENCKRNQNWMFVIYYSSANTFADKKNSDRILFANQENIKISIWIVELMVSWKTKVISCWDPGYLWFVSIRDLMNNLYFHF